MVNRAAGTCPHAAAGPNVQPATQRRSVAVWVGWLTHHKPSVGRARLQSVDRRCWGCPIAALLRAVRSCGKHSRSTMRDQRNKHCAHELASDRLRVVSDKRRRGPTSLGQGRLSPFRRHADRVLKRLIRVNWGPCQPKSNAARWC